MTPTSACLLECLGVSSTSGEYAETSSPEIRENPSRSRLGSNLGSGSGSWFICPKSSLCRAPECRGAECRYDAGSTRVSAASSARGAVGNVDSWWMAWSRAVPANLTEPLLPTTSGTLERDVTGRESLDVPRTCRLAGMASRSAGSSARDSTWEFSWPDVLVFAFFIHPGTSDVE